jgi:hypothetical protein
MRRQAADKVAAVAVADKLQVTRLLEYLKLMAVTDEE